MMKASQRVQQQTVLVVDDDAHIREVVRYAIEKEGIAVLEAENGQIGLDMARRYLPSMLVLDVMMPELNGLDLCRELRKTHAIPILFLSSRDSEVDKIIGLELGGDDYVVKPFSPRELVARIKVMLRRLLPQIETESTATLLTRNRLTLDLSNYRASWHEHSIALTATEFNLLHTFMRTPQKVYTRNELMDADIFRDIVTDRTIDSHIRRLRLKFANAACPNVVETIHGFGYQFGPCQ